MEKMLQNILPQWCFTQNSTPNLTALLEVSELRQQAGKQAAARP